MSKNMRLLGHVLKFIPKSMPNGTRKRYKHGQDTRLKIDEKKCVEPSKTSKKSIWSFFKTKSSQHFDKNQEQQRECERIEFVSEDQATQDFREISKMDGNVYKTCGTAYLLQKKHLENLEEPKLSKEEEILEEMRRDPSLKGQHDPMPTFKSVELRLVELSERKLHPLYKKFMSIPKKPKRFFNMNGNINYETRSGPIAPEQFPPHLKINREMLEKKNILCDYKRAEPPRQMLAQMVEMRLNERPQLKVQNDDCLEKK
ncbi:hypothetical protein ABEB36_007688 [Hypothenemus hampei]|uniref:Uncharacterized protein n=1 Tax=Hypothenemus hampei TaxID=57062 RepID=A0ABD1EUU4_HYPHA